MREEEGLGANGDAAPGERRVGRVRLLEVVAAWARPLCPGSTLLCGAWCWSRSNLFAGSLSCRPRSPLPRQDGPLQAPQPRGPVQLLREPAPSPPRSLATSSPTSSPATASPLFHRHLRSPRPAGCRAPSRGRYSELVQATTRVQLEEGGRASCRRSPAAPRGGPQRPTSEACRQLTPLERARRPRTTPTRRTSSSTSSASRPSSPRPSSSHTASPAPPSRSRTSTSTSSATTSTSTSPSLSCGQRPMPRTSSCSSQSPGCVSSLLSCASRLRRADVRRRSQLLYAPILLAMGHYSNVLYSTHHDAAMKYAAVAHVASWIAQFIGHGAVRPPLSLLTPRRASASFR